MLRVIQNTIIAALCVCVFSSQSFAEKPKTKEAELLFVQSSTSGTFDGKTLTLNSVPSTNYFSDRPERITGHMRTETFVEEWAKGADSFKSNPPNGVLSVLGKKKIENSTVELFNPTLKGNQLSYQVKILEGKPPAQFKNASLFIDDDKAGAFIGGMVAGRVLHNVRRNTQAREAEERGYSTPDSYHRASAPQPCVCNCK